MKNLWLYLWILWVAAIVGFSAWGKQKPEAADPTITVIKIVCPGSTDFYPTIVADVTWSLYPDRPDVSVNYDPCKDAEAILNQGKVRVK